MSAPSTIGRAFFQASSGCLLAAPSTSDRGRPLRACSSTGNQPTCPPPKSIGCPLREGMATSLRAAEGKEELGWVWDVSPRAGPWSPVIQQWGGIGGVMGGEWDGRGVQWEVEGPPTGHLSTHSHIETHSSQNRLFCLAEDPDTGTGLRKRGPLGSPPPPLSNSLWLEKWYF